MRCSGLREHDLLFAVPNRPQRRLDRCTLTEIIVANGYIDRSDPLLQNKVSKPSQTPISEKTLKEKTLGHSAPRYWGSRLKKACRSHSSLSIIGFRSTPQKASHERSLQKLSSARRSKTALKMDACSRSCCLSCSAVPADASPSGLHVRKPNQEFEGHYLATVHGHVEITVKVSGAR